VTDRARAWPGPRWWCRLDVRLALAVLLCLGLLGVGLLSGYRGQSQAREDALTQWHSLHLARYIADRQSSPLIDGEGGFNTSAMANMGMYIGMIQPGLEAYLLDAHGQIRLSSLPEPGARLAQVDLARVRPLLDQTEPMLPVYGENPRRPGESVLVSVTALPATGAPLGYLYVVLQGEQARLVQQAGDRQFWRDTGVSALLLGLGAVALALIGVQTLVTRRLRRLSEQLQRFRQADEEDDAGLAAPPATGDEIDHLSQAALRLQQRVQQQFLGLEEGERLRRELVSNISHDLRTPLANVQGYIETLLLRDSQLSPEQRQLYLRTAMQHGRSLERRVAELFELSRLDAGQTPAHLEPFCMAELLNDVVQGQQLAAQERGVSLLLADDARRDLRVLADIALIERVLQNLVSNALRHTPSGGRVCLTVLPQGDRVLVRVSDNGQGIAAEDLPHIFERYWTRSPASDSAPPDRTGLGLAIVRRILDLHGTTIGVRSAPQQGAEFSFALPAVGTPGPGLTM
jgi:signal transduction histidine kinase